MEFLSTAKADFTKNVDAVKNQAVKTPMTKRHLWSEKEINIMRPVSHSKQPRVR